MAIAIIDTPTGPVSVTENEGAITRLQWHGPQEQGDSPLLQKVRQQVSEYFDGIRTEFDLPLRVEGSDFQRAVCAVMSAIPFGETVTYGDISKPLKVPAQAVGQACGGNPIPLIIPCHRVLAATGLGGFSGGGGGLNGIELKVQLLRHEGAAGLLI
ncbi:cysteine methyltransferase [Marinosulfonomonas sp. PRT-SC04]|nr:cysteine methyltransferase [Marinosulfonomonas sp. PRT-SC04]